MHAFLQPGKAAHATVRRRVLILDDHDFFAACLRTLVDSESDFVVCDVLSTSIDLPERIERLQPDLLVIDLTLGLESGFEVGGRLRELGIATPILFVSSMGSPPPGRLGAISRAAFIAKSRGPADFLSALRKMLATGEDFENTSGALMFSGSAVEV